jgi:uncharacterized glyoxalase superfamily protein PhnB
MTPALPAPVPQIPVSDVHAAAAYYHDNLCFAIDWVEPEIDLAGASRDQCRIFLAGPKFRQTSGTIGPAVTWLNLSSTGEVDALHRAWKTTGAILISPPESTPWGLHEFTASDRDGNRFRVFYDFATPVRESKTQADGITLS